MNEKERDSRLHSGRNFVVTRAIGDADRSFRAQRHTFERPFYTKHRGDAVAEREQRHGRTWFAAENRGRTLPQDVPKPQAQ